MTFRLPPVSRFPRSVPQMGMISPGSAQPAPPGNLDGLLMNGTQRFNQHSYDMGQQANNSINHNQRVIPGAGLTDRDVQDNLDWGVPHVKRVPENVQARYSARSQANLSDMPAEMMSVPTFNHYLKSEPGRRAWGWMRSSRALENTYKIVGVLVTAPSDDYRMKSEIKITTTEGKRSKLPNLWACSGKPVNRGDGLFFIWERCKIELVDTEDSKSASSSDSDSDDDKEGGARAPRYYWRLTPVHMSPREKPPAEMYMREAFRGNFHFYGTVDDVWIVDGEKPGQQGMIARKAIFPEFSDPEVHRKDLTKLRKIQAQLGVHC